MGLFKKLFSNQDAPEQQASAKATIPKMARNMGAASEVNIPPQQGEYAKAIFLFANSGCSEVKRDDEYPRYLIYECGIRRPSEYHQALLADGYFKEADLQTKLLSLKVPELKEILSQMGETTAGKKEILIQRILDNGDTSIIQRYCPKAAYMLSSKGVGYLSEHDNYIRLHKHHSWGIDWKEFEKAHKNGSTFYDTVWGILNSRIGHTSDFGRNEYLCMSQLLIEEGKRPNALEMLLRVLYIDISGTEGADYLQQYKMGLFTKADAKDSFGASIMLAPWVCSTIAEFKDVYTDEMAKRILTWKLPVQICSEQLFMQIVHSIFNGSYDETKTEVALKKAYYAYIDSLK